MAVCGVESPAHNGAFGCSRAGRLELAGVSALPVACRWQPS